MTALSLILPCSNEAERRPATLATYLAQLPTAPRYPSGGRAHAR